MGHEIIVSGQPRQIEFDGSEKPARPGVYRRVMGGNIIMHSLWTGERWNFSRISAEDEAREQKISVFQNRAWRGLAHEPRRK